MLGEAQPAPDNCWRRGGGRGRGRGAGSARAWFQTAEQQADQWTTGVVATTSWTGLTVGHAWAGVSTVSSPPFQAPLPWMPEADRRQVQATLAKPPELCQGLRKGQRSRSSPTFPYVTHELSVRTWRREESDDGVFGESGSSCHTPLLRRPARFNNSTKTEHLLRRLPARKRQ